MLNRPMCLRLANPDALQNFGDVKVGMGVVNVNERGGAFQRFRENARCT